MKYFCQPYIYINLLEGEGGFDDGFRTVLVDDPYTINPSLLHNCIARNRLYSWYASYVQIYYHTHWCITRRERVNWNVYLPDIEDIIFTLCVIQWCIEASLSIVLHTATQHAERYQRVFKKKRCEHSSSIIYLHIRLSLTWIVAYHVKSCLNSGWFCFINHTIINHRLRYGKHNRR